MQDNKGRVEKKRRVSEEGRQAPTDQQPDGTVGLLLGRENVRTCIRHVLPAVISPSIARTQQRRGLYRMRQPVRRFMHSI